MMLGSEQSTPEPRIGIAPDSWGVWNAVDPVQPPPDQYLREVQQAGYHWTELGPFGYLGTDAARIADDLAAHDLELSGGTVFTGLHKGKSAVEEYWPAVAAVAKLVVDLGADQLITLPEMWSRGEDGKVNSPREFSVDEWDSFLAGHDEIGKRLREEFGVHQQFHSHAESQVGSRNEVVRMIEGTDARYVNMCLDTGHFAYYLGDSLRLITEYPDRIGYIHLKQVEPNILADVLKNDIDFVAAVNRGIMIEPPYGTPDYAPILAAIADANPGCFAVVEQDLYPVADFDVPLPIARRTFEHITTCGPKVRVR
jgi:inosose dehydratase